MNKDQAEGAVKGVARDVQFADARNLSVDKEGCGNYGQLRVDSVEGE